MKTPVLFLVPVVLLAGCATTVTYDARTADGPAKSADYPIYVYTEHVKSPRPVEIIGSMHVGDTPFTMAGGSLEKVLDTLRKGARQRGADAIQIKSVDTPSFTSSHYRVDADFLRFATAWETVPLSEAEFRTYLKSQQQTLDPIEGIWVAGDWAQSRIGIMRNSSQPGRDFVGFILKSKNQSWQRGYKKLDIARGSLRTAYHIRYYLDDFQSKGAAITMTGPATRAFLLHLADDSADIFFARE